MILSEKKPCGHAENKILESQSTNTVKNKTPSSLHIVILNMELKLYG